MAYYVLDDNKNLVEALDKQGVLEILEQAIEDGTLEHITEDSAFVSKLKELNSNANFKVWVGTNAQYNALATKDATTLYLITDDNLAEDFDQMGDDITALSQDVSSLSSELRVVDNKIYSVKTIETTDMSVIVSYLDNINLVRMTATLIRPYSTITIVPCWVYSSNSMGTHSSGLMYIDLDTEKWEVVTTIDTTKIQKITIYYLDNNEE